MYIYIYIYICLLVVSITTRGQSIILTVLVSGASLPGSSSMSLMSVDGESGVSGIPSHTASVHSIGSLHT